MMDVSQGEDAAARASTPPPWRAALDILVPVVGFLMMGAFLARPDHTDHVLYCSFILAHFYFLVVIIS